ALQHQFLAEHAKSGISPKDWCEAQGLNYTSARRYIKKPTAQKTAQKKARNAQTEQAAETARYAQSPTDAQTDTQESAQPFNLRNYGLNDMQIRFVEEYLLDLNRTAAYKRAGYKGEGNTAYVNASRLLRNAKVSQAIRDALDERSRRVKVTQDEVLKWWWDIATADATQLTEHHRGCCRYCWGLGFNYQWRDAVEFEEAEEKVKGKEGAMQPKDTGGYGYDSTLDPNPDCPRCNGVGLSRPVFHDTRDLKGAERRLFAGIKEGKFGLEMITRNQDEAMKMVAQHLGMLKTKTELSGPNGEPIQHNHTVSVEDLTDEQLAAIIAGK
ncbi:terminase small subunit, partial [Salmonella enterica subsp. enterica]|nr:terminase small subunit [Salmonella enterica]EGE4882688.1 terminase small subunit [Salmonella enterica subsp. enterica serovar Gaminara]ELJ2785680.1 terminase small subunit [Salmonella enterica subsp. enterica]ECQ0141663.1 terminase small subunit [Salmonella enterica]EJY7179639.1 terminase small subunit [Salmonella enterica]